MVVNTELAGYVPSPFVTPLLAFHYKSATIQAFSFQQVFTPNQVMIFLLMGIEVQQVQWSRTHLSTHL